MKISTKGRYALRVLVDLAEHLNEGYISLKSISERQDISKKYLEQIVPVLNKAGIISTVRGSNGGCRLIKRPDQCSVWEILEATEGNMAPVACLEYETNYCERSKVCDVLFVWQGLHKTIKDYLAGITLQDILDKRMEREINDYTI